MTPEENAARADEARRELRRVVREKHAAGPSDGICGRAHEGPCGPDYLGHVLTITSGMQAIGVESLGREDEPAVGGPR